MALFTTFPDHLFSSIPLPLAGHGYCLLYPFLRAGEYFDIGANRSSQVTHELALPISKHPRAPIVNGPGFNTHAPPAVRSGSTPISVFLCLTALNKNNK
ncbi:MAG TPA: hypothetical protein DD409_04085 [Bacteroidales bacterium]|nr:hypothetical protein [Bacteroidales bacterium]